VRINSVFVWGRGDDIIILCRVVAPDAYAQRPRACSAAASAAGTLQRTYVCVCVCAARIYITVAVRRHRCGFVGFFVFRGSRFPRRLLQLRRWRGARMAFHVYIYAARARCAPPGPVARSACVCDASFASFLPLCHTHYRRQ